MAKTVGSLNTFDCFCKKARPQTSDRIPNADLTKGGSPIVAQSSNGTPHTLNHTALSHLLPQTSLEMHGPGIYQYSYCHSNHHKRDSQITRSKISYSLSSLNHILVHQPVATNSMHLQSTHTAHLQHL